MFITETEAHITFKNKSKTQKLFFFGLSPKNAFTFFGILTEILLLQDPREKNNKFDK